jgi:hypothetical protein
MREGAMRDSKQEDLLQILTRIKLKEIQQENEHNIIEQLPQILEEAMGKAVIDTIKYLKQNNLLRCNQRNKPGPKGPRLQTNIRRTTICFLSKQQISRRQAAQTLKELRLFLPSSRLRTIYGNCEWVKWFNSDTQAFYKQWSADLKRAPKK